MTLALVDTAFSGLLLLGNGNNSNVIKTTTFNKVILPWDRGKIPLITVVKPLYWPHYFIMSLFWGAVVVCTQRYTRGCTVCVDYVSKMCSFKCFNPPHHPYVFGNEAWNMHNVTFQSVLPLPRELKGSSTIKQNAYCNIWTEEKINAHVLKK